MAPPVQPFAMGRRGGREKRRREGDVLSIACNSRHSLFAVVLVSYPGASMHALSLISSDITAKRGLIFLPPSSLSNVTVIIYSSLFPALLCHLSAFHDGQHGALSCFLFATLPGGSGQHGRPAPWLGNLPLPLLLLLPPHFCIPLLRTHDSPPHLRCLVYHHVRHSCRPRRHTALSERHLRPPWPTTTHNWLCNEAKNMFQRVCRACARTLSLLSLTLSFCAYAVPRCG